MIFLQIVHALNPDDALEKVSDFMNFPLHNLLEARRVAIPRMTILLKSQKEQVYLVNGE